MIDREANTVAFTFFVDPGQRVYVRRISFTGNSNTDDEVLRREMRQFEGAWFSTTKVQRSRERLQRLGFFDDVNVETPAVPGSPDQVDVNIDVKERLVNKFHRRHRLLRRSTVCCSTPASRSRTCSAPARSCGVSIDTSSVESSTSASATPTPTTPPMA
jgi:hypothetical protein